MRLVNTDQSQFYSLLWKIITSKNYFPCLLFSRLVQTLPSVAITIRLQGNEIKILSLLCCFRTTDIQKAFCLSQFDESGQFIVDLGRVKMLTPAILWALPTL